MAKKKLGKLKCSKYLEGLEDLEYQLGLVRDLGLVRVLGLEDLEDLW
jgi:hypothetical protein